MPLRNVDYTDRELLYVIRDVRDEDGLASSDDIAAMLGLSGNGKEAASPARRVAVRLSWMKRYGFIDRVEGRKWIITPIGEEIMGGKLSASFSAELDRMKPGSQVLTMRHLTQRAYVDARDEVATAVRREYQHGIAKRVNQHGIAKRVNHR